MVWCGMAWYGDWHGMAWRLAWVGMVVGMGWRLQVFSHSGRCGMADSMV